MRLFLYYGTHSLINQIRKLFKTWVLIFIVACMAIGGLIGFFAATMADIDDERHPDEVVDTPAEIQIPEEAQAQLPPELQEYLEDEQHYPFKDLGIELSQLFEVGTAIIVLGIMVFQAVSADKNGSRIFLPADVPLLFASPMKPQSVLLFRLMTQMGTAIFMTIYMFIQIPNLTLNMGMSVPGAIGVIVGFGLSFIAGKLIQLLLYLVASTHTGFKNKLRFAIYAFLGLLGAGLFAYWKLSGLIHIQAAVKVFSSFWFKLIPFWGWITGFIGSMIAGSYGWALLYTALFIGGTVLLIYIVYHIHADFYEDAMARSEETAALLEQVSDQKTTSLFVTRKREKDRSEKLKRDGLNSGFGASVFFTKAIYNRFRFGTLGYFTKTCFTYLAAAAAVVLFMIFVADSRSIEPVAMVLGGLVFFRAMGNPLEEDTSMDYFLLIPESSWAKLFWSLAGSVVNCLLDLLPGMLLACIVLKASPLKAGAWLLFILTLNIYATVVGAFINLSVPVSAGKTIKQVVQIMFIYFGLLPDVVIIIMGFVFDNPSMGLAGASAVNLLLGLIFFSLTPLFIEPGNGKTFRTESGVCTDLKLAGKDFSSIGLGLLCFMIVSSIGSLALSVYVASKSQALATKTWMIYIMNFLPMYGIGLPACLAVVKRVPSRRYNDRPFGAFNLFKAFCISIFLMYSLNILSTMLVDALHDIIGTSETNPLETLLEADSTLMQILIVVIIGPLVEEYIFRRQLIDRLNVYGEKNAVIFSAVCFGLFHGNLNQCFYAAALGLVFGYIYVRTGRLRYSAVMHMIINFMGSVLTLKLAEGLDESLLEGDITDIIAAIPTNPGVLGFAIFNIAIVILGILGLVFLVTSLGRLSFKGTPLELPKGRRFSTSWINAGMIIFTLFCLGEMAIYLFLL
ncbi:MAG: CPBP family intramembrane metalloprotease [Firmicutes bacterium]|nr:CPBP family intramembrane metalloprotease [Bacillota bacterium]